MTVAGTVCSFFLRVLQGGVTGNSSENKKYFDTSLKAENLIGFEGD